MTFRIGHIRLRMHPLLPLLWVIAGLSGLSRLAAGLCALVLHETGHLAAAYLCGASVSEIEITPLGGVITIENAETLSGVKQFLLACFGPLFSLAGCLLSPALFSSAAVSFSFVCFFAKANLLLLLFNLLPVLPLDGGNMLRAILRRFFHESAVSRVLFFTARAAGLLLCAVSLYFAFRGSLVLSPMFCGLYLIYVSSADARRCTARYVTALIARRQKLENRLALPVETVAAGEETPVGALLRRLRPGKYHIILVLAPDGLTRLGLIEEKELCEAALSNPGMTLGNAAAQKKSLPQRTRTDRRSERT